MSISDGCHLTSLSASAAPWGGLARDCGMRKDILCVEEVIVAKSKKKPRKVTRRKRKTHDVWFNAFMRLQYRELARLEDENERLRKLTR